MVFLIDVDIFKTWAKLIFVATCFSIMYWIGWIMYARTLHPLARVPGPLWPAVARTWLMYRMYMGILRSTCEQFTKEYGPIVRTAPDEVHISDPKAIPIIYPIQNPLEKTDWYLTYQPVTLGPGPDLFTDNSEKHHAAHRRVVGPVYTLSSMLRNEKALDETVTLFMERICGFADRIEGFDFGLWLEMFSFDSVGAVFFGSPFGFLETSSDYGGYIAAVHTAMPLNSFVAMAPLWMRGYLLKIGVMIPTVLKAIMAADGIRQTAVRETGMAQRRTSDVNAKRTDVLSQLLSIMQEKKDSLTIQEIHVEMWAVVIAGSDSTSGALRAIFYYLMKNPEKMAKLTREIDAAFEDGTLTHPVQYNQAMKVHYLRAVIQESLRIFPPFGVPMPRYAPTGGLQILGHHIPAGYKVGMNAMVSQFDKVVFGEDAHEFRPERWLESEASYRTMERAMLVFGAGTRTCIGKHLSNAEMYKVVPEILRRYTVKMAHDEPWKTHNATFLLQSNVVCNVKRRLH